MLRSLLLASILLTGAGLAAPAFADTTATTDGLFVNIRSGPGTSHPIICLAWPNVAFTVTGCAGNWCSVKYLKTTGYMSAKHIAIQN